jgi:methyl coenzyme M reductase subunit D
MINQIQEFHLTLKKGQYVKIVTTVPDYVTKVDRTDVLKDIDGKLLILRANGARVILNCDYVVMACIIERF